MGVDKLPSGKYRIRKKYHGKTYAVLVDHKPSDAEADLLIMSKILNDLDAGDKESMPFGTACALYIDSNYSRLSPSTVREYKRTANTLADWFLQKPISDITQNDLNRLVNGRIRDGKSPKTIRNEHGFISTVLHEFRPDFKATTKLPRPKKRERGDLYIPTKEEVAKIIECAEGTKFWCALELAKLGLRRGEICAVERSKVSDTNILTIDDDLVQNEDNTFVLHGDTKTIESRREIPIPKEVADYIREHGKAYDGFPGSINKWLQRTQAKLGIQKFSLHKMRYYFATQLDQAGVSRADSHRLGGWSPGSDVYERIYRQDEIDRDTERKRKILTDIFE